MDLTLTLIYCGKVDVAGSAGTNLKVVGHFLVVSVHLFGSKSTISRFGEHFRDGQ